MQLAFYRIISLILLNLVAFTLDATPTKLIVRAKSKDAKFIGSSMGGADITITNAITGQMLAQGKTEGGTGNTDLIMRKPRKRHGSIVDEGTAKFETTLDIKKPVLLDIKVASDFNPDGQKIISGTQTWLYPGKNITGDGIIVEIPGLHVSILNNLSASWNQVDQNGGFKIRTEVKMMCGCPISPDGLWDAANFEVTAVIQKRGQVIKRLPLKITGEASIFENTWQPPEQGNYSLTIEAIQTDKYNAGTHQKQLLIE